MVAVAGPTLYYTRQSTTLRLNLNCIGRAEEEFGPLAASAPIRHADDDMLSDDIMNTTLRHVIPLPLLAAGSTGTIVEVEGKSDVVGRLHEMGVRPGCDVRMVRRGRACIVAIDNHRFGFRGADAAHVLVEVDGPVPV